MKFHFKHVLPALLIQFVFSLFIATGVQASQIEQFPDRTVRIIVPVAAGGSADKLTRYLADRLSKKWNQSVVVENVIGAGGTIGTARAARAPADGYTILQQGEGLTLNSILYRDLPFDSQHSFEPIIKAVINPQVLVVHPKTGITSLEQYLALARSKPDSINLALPTNGGIAHVAHELIHLKTGAQVNYIPYSGGGPATVSVLAGHTDATLITLAAVTEHIRSGRLTALAVTSSFRSKALPDVPTVSEAGIVGFEVESWQGYFVPKGTPQDIVLKINQDIQSILDTPEVRSHLEAMGFSVAGGSSARLQDSLNTELPVYANVVKQAGIVLR